MKFLVIAVLLLLSYPTFAQTDSTEIKLQRYKELHDKGLITEQEYDMLKKKEMDLDIKQIPQSKDTISMAKLKRTFKSQIIAGSLELGGAVALMAAGFHFRNTPIYQYNQGTKTKHIAGYRTKDARISFVGAAIFGGIGLYSVIKGGKNRSKYFEGLSISPTSASLEIRF